MTPEAAAQSGKLLNLRQAMALLPHATPEPWGLHPRNKEQRFALELLLDPDVSVVALDGHDLGTKGNISEVLWPKALEELDLCKCVNIAGRYS